MKKGTVNFVAGMLAGAVLFGGSAAYAVGVMAEKSANIVYVDGQRVELDAYQINGSNYVKLRDVAKAVNINVYWDGAVQIDTDTPYTGEAPANAGATAMPAAAKNGAITVPQTDALFVPGEGDRILCDDGTEYEIKDMSRYDNNVFANGKLPPLPTATCNWGLFPDSRLPAVEVKRYSDQYGDDLFVRNLYETRRMQYTIYNALGNEPTAWKNGKPLPTVELTIPAEYEAYTAKFWPWRESEITDLIHSRPNSRYYVAAWDYYHNGVYQYCRYCILSL